MRQFHETCRCSLAGAFLAAALLLSACGGGGGPPSGGENTTTKPPAPTPEPLSPPPHPLAKPLPAEIDESEGGRQVGIGPAFANERPGINDLETRSRRGAFAVGSGRWGDPHGRDGSVSAAEVVRFLRSFQTQNDREGGGDLVFVDFGAQKTLRIESTARALERRATIAALRKQMHTAASELEFEDAARLRDEIKKLEARDLAVADDPFARQSHLRAAEDSALGRPKQARGRAKAPRTRG